MSLSACLFVQVIIGGAAREFDFKEAHTSIGYAAVSYCDATKFESWTCGEQCRAVPALTNVTVSQHKETQGLAFIGYDDASNTIVVSFRGTVLLDFKNWWSDLSSIQLKSTPLCPVKDCQIGGGFLDAYDHLKDKIFIGLRAIVASHPDAQISVTGHSLGASLADIFVLDCHVQGTYINTEITAGSPRTGNKAFADHFDSINGTRWRLTHDQDPIPHLPPGGLAPVLNGFWHIKQEVFFPQEICTGKCEYKVCTEGDGEDKNCIFTQIPFPTPRDHVDYMGWKIGEYDCPP